MMLKRMKRCWVVLRSPACLHVIPKAHTHTHTQHWSALSPHSLRPADVSNPDSYITSTDFFSLSRLRPLHLFYDYT